MPTLLPPFPVDEVTCGLLREALNATHDAEGNVLNAEFSMGRLLEFYSGQVWDDGVQVGYTRDDVIEALLNELERR